jgi:hypothetical protein
MFHLSNALRLDFKNNTILKELFPKVFEDKEVQQFIKKHQKPE